MIPTPHEVGSALTMYAIVHMFYWSGKMLVRHTDIADDFARRLKVAIQHELERLRKQGQHAERLEECYEHNCATL